MDTERLTAVMDSLMNQTVLGELLAPVARALGQVRDTDAVSRVLSMTDFFALGVLPGPRHSDSIVLSYSISATSLSFMELCQNNGMRPRVGARRR